MGYFIYLFKKAFKYGSISSLILIVLGFSLSGLLAYSTPYLLQRAVDALEFNLDFKKFAFFIVLMIVANGLHIFIRHITRLKKYRERFRIRRKFLISAYQHMLGLELPWHNANHSGKTIHIVNSAKSSLDSFVDSLDKYINIFLRLALPIGYLFYLGPAMAAIFTTWLVICMVFVLFMNKKLAYLWGASHVKKQKVSKLFLDYVSNIRTVLSLRLGGKTRSNLSQTNNAVYPIYNQSIKTNENKWSFLVFSVLFLNNLILIYFVWSQIKSGSFNFGVLMALKLYLEMGADGFFDFADNYDFMVENAISIQQADLIFKAPIKENIAQSKPKSIKSFSINKMTFQHRDSKNPNLTISKVPFKAKRGKRIALVGESGSGKSTMMLLIRGLLEPKNAVCDINNKKSACIGDLSESSVLIPQDPEFFEDTIEYNITVGGKYTKRQINEALNMSKFDIVLARLPKGLKTGLFEKGVNLSGGEKQRLALARGLLAAIGRDIVLLDESTSSVDSENEHLIFEHIFKKFQDKFLIASIHKLNMLNYFDEIYVFDNRKIVQYGTLESLRKQPGQFQKIWKKYKGKSLKKSV